VPAVRRQALGAGVTAQPWPVLCLCRNPGEWRVQAPGPCTAGYREAVCCDTCLPATKRWATVAGRGPPTVQALHPDEPSTLF
jgi:hypothetical protein